ncbi:MAG: Maf family protein [Planctomycetota bacterium]
MNAAPPQLVLVSRSPARLALLRRAGCRPIAVSSPFQDPAQPQAPSDLGDPVSAAGDLAQRLAQEKAQAWLDHGENRPLGPFVALSADTVCVDAQGRLVGTPESVDEARAMLRALAGAAHHVVSAGHLVAIGVEGAPPPRSFVDAAEVRVAPLAPDAMEAYLASDAWRGRAGGYDLDDRRAAGWTIDVAGDPAAVTGLPWVKLAPALTELGLIPATPRPETRSPPVARRRSLRTRNPRPPAGASP